jgi:hypothetical protein
MSVVHRLADDRDVNLSAHQRILTIVSVDLPRLQLDLRPSLAKPLRMPGSGSLKALVTAPMPKVPTIPDLARAATVSARSLGLTHSLLSLRTIRHGD